MHYMEDKKVSSSKEKDVASVMAFRNYLKRNKYLFFFHILLISVLACYFIQLQRFYKSEAQLYFTVPSLQDIPGTPLDKNIIAPATASINFCNLYRIIYSKDMLDYLIEKFDLYDHYRIKKNSGYSYLEVRRILVSNISLTENHSQVLSLTVKDAYDNKLASDMANEISKRANEVNKNMFIRNMNLKISIYGTMYNEIKTVTNEDTKNLKASIDSISKMIFAIHLPNSQIEKFGYAKITSTENEFQKLESRIEENMKNYLETSRMYVLALKSIEQDKLPFINVLQEALPDDGKSMTPYWLIIILSLAFSFLITVILFHFYNHYNELLRFFK